MTVLGTPAEEMEAGKVDFVQGDVFSDVNVAMMAHPYPYNGVEFNFLCLDTYAPLCQSYV